ncbi:endolytic transglycosylase MltG [Nocardioides sp. NPDC127503]|uniref:endolytic transglycosylase MltG n=1 Tax=Nocardioides sp. NPDC127503 TaxID=3154516 RepID=UPI00331A8CB9
MPPQQGQPGRRPGPRPVPGAGTPPPGYGRQEPPQRPGGYGGPTYQQQPAFFEGGPSDHDPYFDEEPPKRKRRFGGCLAVLVAMAVVLGGFYVVGDRAIDYVKDMVAPPADYPGPGTDPVSFEVHQGDSVSAVGRNLKEIGVVESVDAFIEAANAEGLTVQVGFYPLKKQMKAADVVEILANPENIDTVNVTITEGSRAKAIYKVLAEKTKKKPAEFKKAAQDAEAIGLPDYAKGNVEGYLFPATYAFPPDATPTEMLAMMVDRWEQALGDNDIEARAKQLKCSDGKACTAEQIMTVASLVEAEGRGDDMPKIARVIYNRLDPKIDDGATNGTLGIDASNAYGIGKSGTTQLTSAELAKDTPYDTRRRAGLPPSPIGSPGDAAIEAALNPAKGNWLFYITVNLKTGETKFTRDYKEFQGWSDDLDAYCAKNKC